MKKKLLPALLAVETVLLVLAAIALIAGREGKELTELLREDGPDGRYTIVIWRVGEPVWSFGPDRLRVRLYDNGSHGKDVSFEAEVGTDGTYARFDVEWTDAGAEITLDGKNQHASVYILPFPE